MQTKRNRCIKYLRPEHLSYHGARTGRRWSDARALRVMRLHTPADELRFRYSR